MHTCEELTFCDKCGKNIHIEDEQISLWGKKRDKSGRFDMIYYDFCKDCVKEIETAIEKIIKEN